MIQYRAFAKEMVAVNLLEHTVEVRSCPKCLPNRVGKMVRVQPHDLHLRWSVVSNCPLITFAFH